MWHILFIVAIAHRVARCVGDSTMFDQCDVHSVMFFWRFVCGCFLTSAEFSLSLSLFNPLLKSERWAIQTALWPTPIVPHDNQRIGDNNGKIRAQRITLQDVHEAKNFWTGQIRV